MIILLGSHDSVYRLLQGIRRGIQKPPSTMQWSHDTASSGNIYEFLKRGFVEKNCLFTFHL